MDGGSISNLRDKYLPELISRLDPTAAAQMRRADLAHAVRGHVHEWLERDGLGNDQLLQRDLVTALINTLISRHTMVIPTIRGAVPIAAPVPAPQAPAAPAVSTPIVSQPLTETHAVHAKSSALRSTVSAAR